jgi:hypothetical protein
MDGRILYLKLLVWELLVWLKYQVDEWERERKSGRERGAIQLGHPVFLLSYCLGHHTIHLQPLHTILPSKRRALRYSKTDLLSQAILMKMGHTRMHAHAYTHKAMFEQPTLYYTV